MRIVLNSLLSLGRKTGIGRYIAELIGPLREQLEPGESLDLFPEGALRSACGWLRGLVGGGGGSAAAGKPSWRGWLKQQAVLAGRQFLQARFASMLRRRPYDLYHEPNHIPMPADVPTIVTLHDLSVLLFPQWHPAARVAHYERSFRDGLSRCVHVLTDTEAVRGEIIRHLGIAAERVTATILGVDPEMRQLPAETVRTRLHALKLPGEYLLCVGTLEPRKNQLMLLRAYARLPLTLRERFPLVFVGGLGWNIDGLLDALSQSTGAIRLGYVPDADLPVLYNGARALLFPSYYEGFGLPPLEMQACGGAVLASTADAVAEVLAGSPAALLDPYDEDAWHAALRRVCEDDDYRHSLRTGAVEAAARFSWRRCAAQTLHVYRRIASPGVVRLSA